jgi:hypothetical protein
MQAVVGMVQGWEQRGNSLTVGVSSHYTVSARGVAQFGSAPRLGRGGRRFESARPDQNLIRDSWIRSVCESRFIMPFPPERSKTMAKAKFDGVIEAVHYKPDGQVDWVRSYLRRGPTFSDRLLIDRQTLIEHLKAGKNYMVGQRVAQFASTFEVSLPVRVVQKDGKDIVVAGDGFSDQDNLPGVPII